MTAWSRRIGATAASAAQDGDAMKHGKNPTRQQKKLLTKWKLNPSDWLVERETEDRIVLIHRHFDNKTKTLPKFSKED